jgi:hypothetical protein
LDGTIYNVQFVAGQYSTVYASTQPFFENNVTGAQDAATALVAALNSLGVGITTSPSVTIYEIPRALFTTPFAGWGSDIALFQSFPTPLWSVSEVSDSFTIGLPPGEEFANFTPVGTVSGGVPEISTWAMMLLGFAGLGFAFRQSRRRVSMA